MPYNTPHFFEQYPKFFSLISSFLPGILLIDQYGNILRADASFAALTGFDTEELTKHNLQEFDAAMDSETLQNKWHQLLAKGALKWTSSWMVDKGDAITLEMEAFLISDNSPGLALCTVSTGAFQKVRQAQILEWFALKQKVAAWHWDITDGSFSAMRGLFVLLGVAPDDLDLGKINLMQLLQKGLSTEQNQEVIAAFRRLNKAKAAFKLLLEYQVKATSKKLMLHAAPVLDQKQLVAIHGVIQELDETTVSNQANQLAQLTLDRSDEMIFWVNKNGNFEYANEAALQTLGYQREEFVSQVHLLKVGIEFTKLDWNRIQKEVAIEPVVRLESTFQRSNGTVFPTAISLTQLENDLICLTARDITHRRQEEKNLQNALLQVQNLSRQLEAENTYLQEEVSINFEEIVSTSPAYQKVLKQIEQVAPTRSTVLIEGETGTGKELLARAIHRLSQRKDRPLVKVDCAALSESLIESELFGHTKGAFTGAEKERTGRFELADGGTIFLDEIGELTADLQVKLLRVLQEGEIQRLGSNRTITVNVRVIAATNRNLKKMVERNEFREDLYYRLHVFPIENLPLRKRKEDIPLLVQYFLEKFSKKNGRPVPQINNSDLERLKKYEFPGNVRELQNIIERAAIFTNGRTLNLGFWHPSSSVRKEVTSAEFQTLEEVQRNHIIEALERTHWRVSGPNGAARLLDINPQTLFSRMRKLNIHLRREASS